MRPRLPSGRVSGASTDLRSDLALPQSLAPSWLPRSFIRLWVAQAISLFGESFSTIAQAFVILNMTGSATSMGFSMALGSLPRLLASLFGGVAVDRFERKRVLVTVDIVSGCLDLALAFIILVGKVQVWHIYAATATRSLARAFYDPAVNSLVPALVDKKALVRANALQQSAMYIASAAGPALAGIMVERAGAGPAVLLASLTFLSSSLLLATTRASSRPISSGKSMWQDLWAGLAYVHQRKWIISVSIAFGLVNMVSGVRTVVMPFICRDLYRSGIVGYGMTLSVASAGSLVAATVLAALKRLPHKHRVISTAMVGFGLSSIALALCPSLAWALPVCFMIGATGPIMCTCANALYQEVVPSELMGRIYAFRVTLAVALVPLANLAGGYASSRIGPVSTLFTAALLGLPAVGLALAARQASHDMPE